MTLTRDWHFLLFSIVVVGTVSFSGSRVAIATEGPPPNQQSPARSEAALAADKLFWATFHGARYSDIQHALDVLTAAYLQTPNDAITAAHVAWLHIWRIGERARTPMAPATITDDMILARKYFQRAVTLDPHEARYLGFLGAAMLSEGALDRDVALTLRASLTMQDAVKAWPEFNLFTAGYVVSGLPADSKQFKEGLDAQWTNMDVCAKSHVDRSQPSYAKFIAIANKTGHERACWNSWIAPHNLEGFFLNMGDMLVKKGDWQTAQAIYRDATESQEFSTWKFQDVLTDRIANAQAHVAEFNKPSPATPMMINSSFACMACHQE